MISEVKISGMPETNPAESLKLLNGRNGRKEGLPGRDPLRLYLPLAPELRPAVGQEPNISALTDLVALRVYCVAGALLTLLTKEGRTVQFVDEPGAADIVIAGSEPETVKNGLLVTVVPPAVVGEAGAYTPTEARYLMYSAAHSSPFQWSAGALQGARMALTRLKEYVQRFEAEAQGSKFSEIEAKTWRRRFYDQLYDDLNTPRALAMLWTLLQSDLSAGSKYPLLVEFCTVLGLEAGVGLEAVRAKPTLNGQTERKSAEPTADKTRDSSKKKPAVQPLTGYEGEQTRPKAPAPSLKPLKKPGPNRSELPAEAQTRRRIGNSRDVRSFLTEPDRFDFTVSLIAYNNLPELRTTLESLLYYIPRSGRSIQIVTVEMNGADEAADYLDGVAARYANFRVIYSQQNLGEAAGRNLAFRQGRGRYMLLLDNGQKLIGDLFEELFKQLEPLEAAGPPALYGAYPLELTRQGDTVKSFARLKRGAKDSEVLEVEALEGSLLCFRRGLVEDVGFMDEHFKLPYALDLDYSFAFRDKGYVVRGLPGLSRFLEQPAGFGRPTYGLVAEQQERQRQKNWQLFLRSWQ